MTSNHCILTTSQGMVFSLLLSLALLGSRALIDGFAITDNTKRAFSRTYSLSDRRSSSSYSFLTAKKNSEDPVPSFGGSDGNERNDPASNKPDGEESSWKLRNDFYTFLNQCSIQTFLFLLKSMRDPQTVLWMENFTQPSIINAKDQNVIVSDSDLISNDAVLPAGNSNECELLRYHGLNAMNMTLFPSWDSYFVKLIEHPIEYYTVESSIARISDYELEINPPRLCNRLLAVREQIATEFVSDLGVLSNTGEEIMKAHWKNLKKELGPLEEEPQEEENDPDGKDGREIKIDPSNPLFLDLSDNSGNAPSPLRKGNFDLLKLLATEEAIQRILNDAGRRKGAEAVSNKYLHDFYAARILTYFDGSQPYGVADSFVQELLVSPPVVRKSKGRTALIDPTRLAELILHTRKRVSLEWKALAEAVPDEHLAIRRLQLDQLIKGMGSDGVSFEDALKESSEPTSTEMPPLCEPLSFTSNNAVLFEEKEVGRGEMVAFGMNATSVFE